MSANAPVPPPRPRFYRRRGFWIGSGLGVLGVVLLLLVAVYWLLQTVAGRDVLLAQVVARLPAGASFTWSGMDGPLAGPLTLRNVDFRYQDIHFTAERVHLDPDIRPLLGRKLRLDALELSNATLNLGKSEEPFELPSWPGSLPQLALPLAVQADTIAVDNLRVTQLQQPMIELRRIRGGLEAANGELRMRKLVVDSDRGDFRIDGDYLPAKDYKTNLTASALLPASRGRTPASVGLVARGDLAKMEIALAGRAPEPLRATLVFTGRDDPRWEFKAATKVLDLSLLLPPAEGEQASAAALAFDLSASGKGGDAQLQGTLQQGDLQATLQPSHVVLADQVLEVRQLVVDAFEGRTRLQGRADFRDPDNATFNFAVNASGLRWVPAPDPATPQAQALPVELKQARLGVAGNLKAWAAIGRAEVERDAQQAGLRFDVRGNDQRAHIQQLQASTPGGALDVTGEVAWVQVLSWDVQATLAKFDPGYFAPGWDGSLSGKVASKGRQLPAPAGGVSPGYELTAQIDALKGQLRQRALDASGKFALQGTQGEGQLKLALGNSRIAAQGKVGDTLAIDAQLQPLQLDDLLPGGAGTLRGNLQVKGRSDAPEISADLAGSGLRWEGYSADALSLRGRLPWRGGGGTLALQGTAINAGMVLDELRVQARGAVEDLDLDAEVRSATAALALRGDVRRSGTRWQGQLAALRIAPAKGDAWALRQPAQFALDGAAFRLSDTCLAAAGGGALCVQADWPREGLSVKSTALPLTLVQPWLPKQDGRQITLRGDVALDGNFRPRGNAWEGGFELTSMEGGVRLGEPRFSVDLGNNPNRGELVRYDHFSLRATFDPQHINGYLGVGFQGNGFVDAKFDTGWDDYAPLNGELYMNISRLDWLQLFVAEIDRPKGLVEGHVSLRGTRSKPLLGGEATLSDFTAEYPSMGLSLSEGKGRFEALPDGSAKITASAKSGDGTLNVDGGLSWYGEGTPLKLNIHGQNVLAYNTSELRVVANPDLQFGIEGKVMQLRGRVTVPEADIDLERLDRGTSVSEDVVVLDPVDPEQTAASPLDMQLTIALGDKVKMNGFGLKGALTGQMQIISQPGREMIANGGLDVSGRYKAYGQDLTITRGQLTWNNNIVSDPRINIRAERKIGDVTAGIDVSGRAESPRADVWSDPSLSQAEAMSYLVLGRGLATASSSETEQVTAASAALSAGSGLIASQLGAKLGLDDAGVQQSSTLGGSVLGFGKYLSPKLYVGYGVSMVGSGSVLTLKYLLSRGFDVEVESSTVETKGSVNWRKEK
ncbi:MAG: translocation/assembly module TamB domain-containing protein [Pseudomonas sp.]